MKIETKFKVGDVVYKINSEYKKQTCKICEGKKTVRIKDMEFQCPHCNGLGETQDKEVWFVEDELRIYEIRVWSVEHPIEIRYFDTKQDIVAYEEDCFATREEAQDKCDELNFKNEFAKELENKCK